MNEADRSEMAEAPLDSSDAFSALIASLRAAGADQFDPLRLVYIEVLARRATSHHGSARSLLDAKVSQALAVLKERFERAQGDARETIARTVSLFPNVTDDLQRFFVAGDFKGLQRFISNVETSEPRGSLGALVRQLEQHSAGSLDAGSDRNARSRPELKTIRESRDVWSKLSVDKEVTRALGQAPKNAGPINSHMLVLRSLALMRDISPDYLNRFMSYADTLLWLDQGDKEKLGDAKKVPVKRAAKK